MFDVDVKLCRGPRREGAWTGAVDERLDSDAFIIPGLGDAGNRAYGTE